MDSELLASLRRRARTGLRRPLASPLVLLALLALPAVASGADPAPAPVTLENGQGDPDEVAAFRETVARFANRMSEFEGEVRDIIEQREATERAQLQKGYGALMTGLDDDDQALRATAIKRFEAFLDKYPSSAHTPHVMFRLSELYFEQAEESWYVSDQEYQHLIEGMGEDDFDRAPEEPKKDYRRSIALYERIIRDYPDYEYVDGCYYMLGYCRSELVSAQADEAEGLKMFQALVDTHPDSKFAAAAHLRIGEYYFDYNKLREAIPHYEKVIELEGKDGRLYDAGLYKLAWTYYKLSDYDRALTLLSNLLDWSESVYFVKTGRESAMAPEAIEYTAISFSDVADLEKRSPVAVAQGFYGKYGEREFESKVYVRLADVLTQQARYLEAIEVYEEMQRRWPLNPDNPTYQWTVGTLHMSLAVPDPVAAQKAVATLNERYNDDTDWWKSNRNNPDALAVASRYIEQSLAAVATQYHTAALETNNPDDFRKASEMYSQYLTKFPFAEDYYQIQWWLADTLLKSGRLEEAQREYEQLLKGGDHNYKEGALWLVMQIRRQRLLDKYGGFETVPPDAVVENTVTLKSGRTRSIYALNGDYKEFIAACDQLVDADFDAAVDKVRGQLADATVDAERQQLSEELEVIQAYAQGLNAYRHALAYLPAQILYYHGRFDEARPRFDKIIQRWPQKNEAAYSASLVVDSYVEEEDLVNVRKKTSEYASGPPLGEGAIAADKQRDFKDKQEMATFNIALGLIEQNEREKAAEAFLDFRRQFPYSKYAEEALYNAANNYEIVGQIENATRLFEDYVVNYPADERSRPLFFRLASNYAGTLNLDQAVKYYEQLYNQTKGKGVEYQDAPAALYNAGFLRIGLGDHEGAARNFERYARDNSNLPDAEEVLFMAGEQWEEVGPQQALGFYKRYVRSNPDTNPDHVMEAYYRIAKLTEETAGEREVDDAWDDLAAAYNRLAPKGKVGSAGRHYAAHAEFRQIQDDLEAFREIKFTANDDKNADLLLNIKKAQLAAIDQRGSALVATYQDFEYSSGALYVIGVGYLLYSDMLYNAPVPKGFDEEMELLYREEIDKIRIPVEDKGKARLEANLQTAKDQKMWSEWMSKTIDELNRRYPAAYAQEKQELRGVADSHYVPTAGPISVRAAAADKSEGE